MQQTSTQRHVCHTKLSHLVGSPQRSLNELCVHFVPYRIKSPSIYQAFSTFLNSHSCGLIFAKLLSKLHLRACCSQFDELTLKQVAETSAQSRLTEPTTPAGDSKIRNASASQSAFSVRTCPAVYVITSTWQSHMSLLVLKNTRYTYPEKAGVGDSTPSLATMFQSLTSPPKQRLRSKTFQLDGCGGFSIRIYLHHCGQMLMNRRTRVMTGLLRERHRGQTNQGSFC
jgi:hypothetical protein